MKRGGLLIALFLSLGLNLGVLLGMLRDAPSDAPEGDSRPPDSSRSVESRAEPPDGGLPDGGPPGVEPPGVEPRGAGIPRALPRALHRLADRMGLEGEQREQFLALQQHFLKQTIEARRRLEGIHRAMRAEMLAEQPDRQVVEQCLQEAADAHLQLETAFAENLLASRDLLDEEQEKELFRFFRRLKHFGDDARRRQEQWQGQWQGRNADRPFLRRMQEQRRQRLEQRQRSSTEDGSTRNREEQKDPRQSPSSTGIRADRHQSRPKSKKPI